MTTNRIIIVHALRTTNIFSEAKSCESMPPNTCKKCQRGQKCFGRDLCGEFNCSQSAEVKDLLNIPCLLFLPFQEDPTHDPAKLDQEMEKLFSDWRSYQTTDEVVEMTSLERPPTISNVEEKKVLKLFRY